MLKHYGNFDNILAYYGVKFDICLKISPKRIAEIGVRYGYSAYAFLSASPKAFYDGYDDQSGKDGGVKGDTFFYVKEMLGSYVPKSQVELYKCDTQSLSSLIRTDYDFIHIDGNHSYKGAYHDITISMLSCISGGYILVDDYTHIKSVRQAVDDFVKSNQKRIDSTKFIPSYRGEFLIKKRSK
jgi:hypothetical protein